MILGAKGNIGSYLCKYLESRLHGTNQDLIQVDIKFSKSERFNCRTIGEIEREEFLSRDLILGVIGCSILRREHFEDLILNGTKSKILIASGSTKTAEYTDLIHWLDELSFSEDKKIGGHPVRLEFDRILDPQSGIDQGGKVSFFVSKDGVEIEKTFFLLSDLSPINFLFTEFRRKGWMRSSGNLRPWLWEWRINPKTGGFYRRGSMQWIMKSILGEIRFNFLICFYSMFAPISKPL